MSGLSRLALAALLALAPALVAQSLPDIGEAELEDVKLLLLDSKGLARGTLTAKSAKKARDGRISVSSAVLSYSRDDGALTLTASKLLYSPGAAEFEAPGGFKAEFPDGGVLEVPKGSAGISAGEKVSLKAVVVGEAHLRVGKDGSTPLDGRLQNPTLDLVIGGKGRVESINARGSKGATFLARFSRLPSLGGSAEPALLRLTCNSDVSFDLTPAEAELRLGGRVRGSVEQTQRAFALSCNKLRLRASAEGNSFAPAELEAEGGASVNSQDLDASAGHLLLTENGSVHKATLTRDALARIRRGEELMELQARDNAVVVASGTGESVELLLKGSAQLLAAGQRLDAKGARLAEWVVQGDEIAGTRGDVPMWPAEPGGLFSFQVSGKGFAPLLALAGADGKESLTVYGRSASGRLLSAQTGSMLVDSTVLGPDIFVSALGPFHLVRDLRKALGLRPLDTAQDANADPGRVLIRAQESLRLNWLSRGGEAKALFSRACGAVELRQEPSRRDDRELCTLVGSTVTLDFNESRVGYALVEAASGDVRATMGHDLICCARFELKGDGESQHAQLAAPGRVIIRDEETLAYFHGALSHLKLEGSAQSPDAAWLVFAGDGSVSSTPDAQRFEFGAARLVFVRGDFVKPRAGPRAFDDLEELEEDDVALLFEARGERLVGDVRMSGPADAQTLAYAFELSGQPLLRSVTDGLLATSTGPITIEASQRRLRGPAGRREVFLQGSTLRLGENAAVRFDQAPRYFDESGKLGGFAYDGLWTVRAESSLEISFIPPGIALQRAQRTMAQLGRSTPHWGAFLERLAAFEQSLSNLNIAELSADDALRVAEIQGLLNDARKSLRVAFDFAVRGDEPTSAKLRQSALGCEARAFALLGPDYTLAARGYCEIELRGKSGEALPLVMGMSQLDLGFSALAEVRQLRGEGPVRIVRGRYVLSGKQIVRRDDGALTLDGARLTLPAEVGVEIEGATTITARSLSAAGRVRVSGRQLRIKATLFAPAEKK